MKSIRAGDLVKFVKGRSDELEKTLFPDAVSDDVYLVIVGPKMMVYSNSGVSSQELLSVEIMKGTQIKKVPVSILERAEKGKRISAEKL